ncbi:MAG: hypothetical protein HY644_05325 [Acidobacteria bacterium]|nr:hypothetical protein [Acidobacteriota bacterium]
MLENMKILVVYFSFTGNVRTLASWIQAELEAVAEVTFKVIEPRSPHDYWGWLARSFLPGWRVAIKETTTDLAPFDLICFGFPKWTLSCPPANQYLKIMKHSQGKRFALFMSYGGFDQERYLRSMVRKVVKRGGYIVAAQAIKRSAIRQGAHSEALRSFCRRAMAGCARDPKG